MSSPIRFDISVIIPARNEAALIGRTLDAVLASVGDLHQLDPATIFLPHTSVEVFVIDDASSDQTREIVHAYTERHGVRLLVCKHSKAASSRNIGARVTSGRLLVFVDADTLMAPHTLRTIKQHCDVSGRQAGITRLVSLEGGVRAWAWWTFWEHVRRLPMPRAKAMPALMFCTRDAFEHFGPFDEAVRIGEEWPILAGVYQKYPHSFIYDRTLPAQTSSRRMELQPWGYARTLLKYVWAILHMSGRIEYTDRLRHSSYRGKKTT